MKHILALTLAMVPLGCSIDPGRTPDHVEIAGQVVLKGKLISQATLHLQPTGSGTQAELAVKEGKFRGTITPGKYTYYLSGGGSVIPEKYRSGSLDRQVELSGGTWNVPLE